MLLLYQDEDHYKAKLLLVHLENMYVLTVSRGALSGQIVMSHS